jgi:hypothetical protein
MFSPVEKNYRPSGIAQRAPDDAVTSLAATRGGIPKDHDVNVR